MKTISLFRCLPAIVLTNCLSPVYCQTTSSGRGAERLEAAISRLDRYVQEGMQKTGVPGVAVAIVYRDRVVHLKGFGVREAGKPAAIDPDTVFQLASVSKPIASTVVASLVGTRDVTWDSRIVDIDKEFVLSDNSVTQQLTIRDLLSHRSGLATASGDALEDLGFARADILRQIRLLPLPNRFRRDYMYSNFGYTEGAIAAAKAANQQWEILAEERLFRPLRMRSTSYRYSDYQARSNRSSIHVFVDGKAMARYQRRPDAEAPAGSASSSVRDLSRWLRLHLANGRFNGRQIVDAAALKETHSPQIQTGVDSSGRPQHYGLGWNVNTDAAGNPILSHSGAFFLGVGTNVRFFPARQVGIVVLTNAQPTGLAEAVGMAFFDLLDAPEPAQDYITLFGNYFKQAIEETNKAVTDYSKLTRPSSPTPPAPLSSYTGAYRNDYYGAIEITEQNGLLWMRFPPTGRLYSLSHWNGDLFTYRFEEEQGIGTRGITFTRGATPQVKVDNLTLEGDGVFLKVSN